jgi:hypothetical protein
LIRKPQIKLARFYGIIAPTNEHGPRRIARQWRRGWTASLPEMSFQAFPPKDE